MAFLPPAVLNKSKAKKALGNTCAICGYNNHDRNLVIYKKGEHIFKLTRSWKAFFEDIEDYNLLCQRCFLEIENPKIRNDGKITARMERRWKNKERAIKELGGHCQICGYSNPDGLSFHHVNSANKTFCISDKLYYQWYNLEDEIFKCQLLCVNCHADLHISRGEY